MTLEDQSEPNGERYRVRPILRRQPLPRKRHMGLHRLGRDAERVGGHPIGHPVRETAQHVKLSRGGWQAARRREVKIRQVAAEVALHA